EPEPRVPVTIKMTDDIHEVLKQPRPGNGAVFRDMSDENNRDVLLFRYTDEGCRDLADLSRSASATLYLIARDGLHGINDDERRVDCLNLTEHGCQVILARQEQCVVQGSRPLGAHPNL